MYKCHDQTHSLILLKFPQELNVISANANVFSKCSQFIISSPFTVLVLQLNGSTPEKNGPSYPPTHESGQMKG